MLHEKDPAHSFEIVRKEGPLPKQPFTAEASPLELRAKARKIPGWRMDRFGLVGLLQQSPAHSDEPIETVALIPMGAARLRISAFPTVANGSSAHEWIAK
ncbi:MAG TPA: hypothetical protein VK395_14305 [Gemmataceae bacterium]|nr:hypothetical protein [Gemmataceae bacterium]